MADSRFSPEIIAPREASPSDRLFIFRKREILVRRSEDSVEVPTFGQFNGEVELAPPRYVGRIGKVLCYASDFGDRTPPEGYTFENLRSVFLESEAHWRPAISTAVLVVDWDLNHRFCGRCGAETSPAEDEWCRKCPSCGHVAYPRISPAVIVAVLREGKILLAHNRRFSAPIYSLIAGFVEPGEYLEDTVRREVHEETGLRVGNIRYFASQSWPFPDSLMIGFVADYESGAIALNDELADAAWFEPSDMPNIPGHGTISRRIIDWYLETGGGGALPAETEHRA